MLPWIEPDHNPTIRVLSLGAGVQSTVLALMAAREEIGPMPDCAIFADTQWEPASIYDHIDWLETQLPFPVHRVTAGNIRQDQIDKRNTTGQSFSSMPYYTANGAMGKRQCTREYKVEPIQRKIRELLGFGKGKRIPKGVFAEQWIGISQDELQRVKNARKKWQVNRWPLLEKKMSRQDCLDKWQSWGMNRKLEKSACIGCPFHQNDLWRDMKINDPVSWKDACDFDDAIRDGTMKEKQFLHRSLKPLSKADIDSAEDKGQISFLGECEGMCGI